MALINDALNVGIFLFPMPVLLAIVLELTPKLTHIRSRRVLPGRATFISNQETHHEVSKVRHVSLSAPYYMLFKRKRKPSRIPSVKREEMFWAFQLELQSRSASLSERSREILDARFNMPDWTLRETPLAHFPGEEEYTGRVEEFSGIMGDGIVLLWKYYNGDIKKTRIKTFQGTNGQVWVNAKQIFYALMFTTHEPNENMSVEETEERIEQYHLNTLRKYGTQDLTAEEHMLKVWYQHKGDLEKLRAQEMQEFGAETPINSRYVFRCIYSYERLTTLNFWQVRKTCIKCWASANLHHYNSLLACFWCKHTAVDLCHQLVWAWGWAQWYAEEIWLHFEFFVEPCVFLAGSVVDRIEIWYGDRRWAQFDVRLQDEGRFLEEQLGVGGMGGV
ncbi:MAG: hypothetical protein MMC33_010728 [Icmadophila ericetorum]|nr:hypothetical protein [Icmadophila ericetorum]